jgi:hypothetical protein
MAMDDEELIKEFIRVAPPGSVLKNDDLLKRLVFVELDVVAICVREIEWPTPSEPVSHWTVVTQLPLDASEAQIDTAVRSVLDDPRFFGVCATCRERNPNGWMHDADVCQGCSGAVY